MNEARTGSAKRWWAVTLSELLVPGKLMPATVDGVDYVLFRDAQSVARALLDECAHRRAPLSLGKITAAGLVECPYHGWRYDGQSGACKVIPNLSKDEQVPRAYRVPPFPVTERQGIVYLCSGGVEGEVDLEIAPSAESADESHGAQLISYPRALWVDLLLDAPSAILAIENVSVVDNHWFGEPMIKDGTLILDYAAQWTDQVSPAAVADYPLMVRIALDIARESARVEVRSDEDDVLSTAWLESTPVKPGLTLTLWRAALGAVAAEQPVSIGLKQQVDPNLVKSSQGSVSKLRRLGMIQTAGRHEVAQMGAVA